VHQNGCDGKAIFELRIRLLNHISGIFNLFEIIGHNYYEITLA